MKLLICLLAVSQFLILPNLSFRWGKEVAAQIFIILSICSLIWQRNKTIALFVLWSLFLFFLFKGMNINDVGGGTNYQLNPSAFFNIINIERQTPEGAEMQGVGVVGRIVFGKQALKQLFLIFDRFCIQII